MQCVNEHDLLKENYSNFLSKRKKLKSFIEIIRPPYTTVIIEKFIQYFSENSKLVLSFLQSIENYLSKPDHKYSHAKESYNSLKIEYDSFIDYVRNTLDHFFFNKDSEDGYMSPSNPFHSYIIELDENETLNNQMMTEIKEQQTTFTILFRKLKRKVERMLHKSKFIWKKFKNKEKRNKKLLKLSNINIKTKTSFEDEDPYLIISRFFQSYLNSGSWSWTKWNEYIRKILETRPEWFYTFVELSQNMGINFDEMFRSDLESIESNNVRLNYPKTTKIINNNEGKSVIFNTDQKEDTKDEIIHNELYCNVCKQQFNSGRSFHVHLRGVRHIQNEVEIAIKDNPIKCDIVFDVQEQEKIDEDFNEDSEEMISCQDCEFKFSNVQQLTEHKSMIHTKPIPEIKQPLIQPLLNQSLQPLIALQYITEYQFLDPALTPRYYCSICQLVFMKHNILQHLLSIQHRLLYIKIDHPLLYKLLDQDRSKLHIKLKRLDIYAEQLEHHEGRSKIKIYRETNNSDDDDENNNEDNNNNDNNNNDCSDNEIEDGELNDDTSHTAINFEQFNNKDELEAGEIDSSDDDDDDGRIKKHSLKHLLGTKYENYIGLPKTTLSKWKFKCIKKLNDNHKIIDNKKSVLQLTFKNRIIDDYIIKENSKKYKKVSDKLIDQFKYEVDLILGKIQNNDNCNEFGKYESNKQNTIPLPAPSVQTNPAYGLLGNSEKLSRHASFLGINSNDSKLPQFQPSKISTFNNCTTQSALVNNINIPTITMPLMYTPRGILNHYPHGYIPFPTFSSRMPVFRGIPPSPIRKYKPS